jgi:sigma54-dependent transcription regulator
METYVIELTDQRAYKLLKELEELHLIRLIKSPSQLSSLRRKINTKMSNEDIDNQLKSVRNEWQRDAHFTVLHIDANGYKFNRNDK